LLPLILPYVYLSFFFHYWEHPTAEAEAEAEAEKAQQMRQAQSEILGAQKARRVEAEAEEAMA
jgi:hypothetical protein